MTTLDLDDLPPRIAKALAALGEGEELVLAQGGAVVARLVVAESAAPMPAEPLSELPPEDQVREVLEHFSQMINDEF